MSNFKLEFTYPWLLLLIIPALALALLPFFKMRKQYRRNRNRVVSLVLHIIVLLCAVLLISGITLSFDVINKQNEIILLVDSSFSNEAEKQKKDEFIQNVIDDCGTDYKIGIVKFGFDQVYAAELTNDAREAYRLYLNSADPDTTATDIAAALRYSGELFTNKTASKIVLISDGLQTDEDAADVIQAVAAQGTKVDVVSFANEGYPEMQIVSVETPDYNVALNENFTIKITLQNNIDTENLTATLSVFDNGTELPATTFSAIKGTQTVEITHAFSEEGLHELRFSVAAEGDTVSQNNGYYSYLNMQVFDKILIIEKDEEESLNLQTALEEQYEVSSLSIQSDLALMPQTLGELCAYDQIILYNISNSDMPTGLDGLLFSYVSDLGGGLFTVGGSPDRGDDGSLIPHAYNRDDMFGTLYQQMLPVNVINYTPPVAVMLVIDCSGSMSEGENSPLVLAKQGALNCLDALTPADFCGVITFDSQSSEDLKLTSLAEREKIREKILSIPEKGEGSTIFADAIRRAGAALSTVDVDKKHIILVSDGMPGDGPEAYNEFIDANMRNGITMSIVTAGDIRDSQFIEWMDDAAERGGGKHYDTGTVSGSALSKAIYDDLVNNAISEIAYGEPFTMKINHVTPAVAGIDQSDLNELPFTGYYGTRAKEGAQVPLTGDFSVPMFAEWKLGNGTVASFMSDLGGEWSGNFLNDERGKRLLTNMINGVFPTEEVKIKDMRLTLKEDNYTSALNVYTDREEDDTVEVTVTPVTPSAVEFYSSSPISVEASDSFTRFTFTIKQPGVYLITAQRKNAAGEVVAEESIYKTFSYSGEYNAFPDTDEVGENLLISLAEYGNGAVIEDTLDIFASFEKILHKTVDPRLALLITAIVCFLLDIAVRKFKFKWPHEIVRDHKAKKQLAAGGNGKNKGSNSQ